MNSQRRQPASASHLEVVERPHDRPAYTYVPKTRRRHRGRFRDRMMRRLIIVALMAVVATGTWWLMGITDRAPGALVQTLTSLPGVETQPSLAPDGRHVAFSWNGPAGDNEDIYVKPIGQDDSLRLTTDAAVDYSPVWSPDGSEIAFIRRRGDRDVIYTVSPATRVERKWAEFGSSANIFFECFGCRRPLLAWAPNGRGLAVGGVRDGETTGIFLVTADGKHTLLIGLQADIRGLISPAFAPAGNALAYGACANPQRCDLMIADLDDTLGVRGEPRVVTSQQVLLGVVWSGDGQSLIFSAADQWLNPFYLYRVAVSGPDREPERIEMAGVAATPTVSAASHRVAFARRSLDSDIWKVDADGMARRVQASSFHDKDAYFSPDGAKIAFVSDRLEDATEVYVANSDGSDVRQVTRGVRGAGDPRWSPDNRWIAFDAKGTDGNWHVWIVDAEGGQPRRLTSESFSETLPSWSRSGDRVYFGSDRDGTGTQIWRVSASGGDPEKMTTGGGTAPFESADGSQIYFCKQPGSLFSMPATGGPAHLVVEPIEGATHYWPATGGVFYIPGQESRPPRSFEVWFFDAQTGKSRLQRSLKLDDIQPGLSVSASGELLVSSLNLAALNVDLMLIDNFR